MPPILSKDLEDIFSAWSDFQTRVPVKLCTVQNKRHFRAMAAFLDELVDEIGERESHPLLGLLDIVSFFVLDYEERNVEVPDFGRNAVRRISRRTNRAIAAMAKKPSRAHTLTKSDSAIMYRGIKIPRISGTRSPTSMALREALLSKYKK